MILVIIVLIASIWDLFVGQRTECKTFLPRSTCSFIHKIIHSIIIYGVLIVLKKTIPTLPKPIPTAIINIFALRIALYCLLISKMDAGL